MVEQLRWEGAGAHAKMCDLYRKQSETERCVQ